MKGFSFSQKTKDSADIDSLTKAFSITHTNSSLSSNSSNSISSGGSTSKLSSLSHSLLPHKHPHGHHHHHHSHHHSSSSSLNQIGGTSWLPNVLPTNPIEFVILSFQLLLSVPGPTIKELKEDLIPLLFWENYLHRANTREVNINGLLDIIESVFRARFKTLKFRVKNELIDNDGSGLVFKFFDFNLFIFLCCFFIFSTTNFFIFFYWNS